MLALLTLQDPDLALGHRRTLVQAAEMGDFFGWGDPAAQELYQGMAIFLAGSKGDPALAAARAVERARALLVPTHRPELAAGIRALQRGAGLVDRGEIRRRTWGGRFVHYEVPFALGTPAALRVPALGDPLSDLVLLWPHARSRLDRERIALVTVGVKGGWAHDLWYPGYCWADTPQSWRPPGIEEDGSFVCTALSAALLRLQALEMGEGTWERAGRLAAGEGVPGRGFPVVAAFMREGKSAASTLKPELVAEILSRAFG